MIRSIIVIIFCSFLLASCGTQSTKNIKSASVYTSQNEREIKKYSDFIDWTEYSRVFHTDTSNCESFWKGRGLVAIVENKKAIVESNNVDLYLKTEKLSMWVCNLPKEITTKNIGDTVVVSASVFNTFGDERTWGEPTILYKAAIKDEIIKCMK